MCDENSPLYENLKNVFYLILSNFNSKIEEQKSKELYSNVNKNQNSNKKMKIT